MLVVSVIQKHKVSERNAMGTKIDRPTKTAKEAPHESCEVRDRIFTYFKKHRARGLRDELRRGERNQPYVTIRSARKYNIALKFAAGGEIWTYLFSKDPDGVFDGQVLGGIRRAPSTGATFADCSNEPRRGQNTRNVLKLHRPFDWRTFRDKEISALLDDYNWLVSELERIGVM